MLNRTDDSINEKYIINSLINYYAELEDSISEHKKVKKNLEEIILDYFKVCDINENPVDSIENNNIRVERVERVTKQAITYDEIDVAARDLNIYDIKKNYNTSEYFLKKIYSEDKEEIDIHSTYISYVNENKDEDKIKLVEYLIKHNKLSMLERCLDKGVNITGLDYKLKIIKL